MTAVYKMMEPAIFAAGVSSKNFALTRTLKKKNCGSNSCNSPHTLFTVCSLFHYATFSDLFLIAAIS